MDKRSWIDLVGVRFPQYNSNPKYVAAQLERTFNFILYYAFRSNLSNFDMYTREYEATIQQDSRGTWYSNIPVKLVQLPDNLEQVRRITATGDKKTILFCGIPKDAWSSFNLLDVSKVSEYTPYTVTNGRVEYFNEPPVKTVLMDLVRCFTDYADDEQIPCPSGQDQVFEQILESFLNGAQIPEKYNM